MDFIEPSAPEPAGPARVARDWHALHGQPWRIAV